MVHLSLKRSVTGETRHEQ
ncbi:hypothetical protein E2C01_031123 [Portunus trituberculatus]|uniref:Uncharacterized protein n=1 Tax=Portunus trituberculatus TaxID=210409 RepID=A0A5B7EW19_PORTR|nr:hypothetical protein [Portunus trituberculatus]